MIGLGSRWVVPIVAVTVQGLAHGAPQMGRLNILTDVHGYDTGKGVVVPLRGIAEWLGATVAYDKPNITVTKGERKVQLTVGSRQALVDGRTVQLSAPPKVYGGITCVPVRFVAEGLGADVGYRANRGDSWDQLTGVPHVILAQGSQTARVLVHKAPCDVVAGMVRYWEDDGIGAYGWEWIFEAYAVKGAYVATSDPHGWISGAPVSYMPDRPNWQGFSAEGGDALWALRGGRWRPVLSFGLAVLQPHELREAGVPLSVVKAFGIRVLDHDLPRAR